MNRETQQLKHRLEQATSALPVDARTLDEETAMLRESWQMLGRLLIQDRSVPRPEVVREVIPEVVPVGSRSKVDRIALESYPTRASGMWLVGCAASALAMLALWLLRPTPMTSTPVVDGESLVGAESGQVGKMIARPTNSPASLATSQPRSGDIPSSGDLAWEDGWENDFTRSALVVERFHTLPAGDPSLSRLQDEFSELARDFDSSSL